MPRISEATAGGINVLAFLDMLAVSEGTFGLGDDGYNIFVGSSASKPHTFSSYRDHPGIVIVLRNKVGDITGRSSAAGRYQFLRRTWQGLVRGYGLQSFTPVAQDIGAIRLIKEQKAYDDVAAGRFHDAVVKCNNIWASLPGAGYGQRENKMLALKEAYEHMGGTVV